MIRQAMLDALTSRDELWDIVVIGGGATGLGTALDAASRGYRTALVEAADFAKGTSSRSTKLIHGGVRYLRQGKIRMVRDSLLERGRLQHNAPHIVHPRQFVIPSYTRTGRYYFYAGMKAYDLLAGKLGFEPSRLLNSRQTLEALPTLVPDGLRGGVSYADGQFDDARLALALAQTLVREGGVALNYAPVVKLLKSGGRLSGVVARDIENGQEFELRAKVIVNATGVFGESIMRLDESATAHSSQTPKIVASQGTHLVLPREFLPSRSAMLIPHTDDARVLFAIPWHDRTLFGTTDNCVDNIALEPRPLGSEIDYLLEHAGRFLTKQPQRSDILSVFAGLRPLVGKLHSGTETSKLSREHAILKSSAGLITIIGGKWTTYRKMGQDVVDLAAQIGSLPIRRSRTESLPLHGAAAPTDLNTLESVADPLAIYGTDRSSLWKLISSDTASSALLSSRLPYLAAQVTWAVKHEMARTVEDVLARRTRALLLDAKASVEIAEATAAIMQPLLNQDSQWKTGQVREFRELANGYLVQSPT